MMYATKHVKYYHAGGMEFSDKKSAMEYSKVCADKKIQVIRKLEQVYIAEGVDMDGWQMVRIRKLYPYRNHGCREYVRLTPNEHKALEFITGVIGWHSFDNTVKRYVLGLERKGFVTVQGSQFKLAEKFCGEEVQNELSGTL